MNIYLKKLSKGSWAFFDETLSAVITAYLVIYSHSVCSAVEISPQIISKKIIDIAEDALKVQKIQKMIDNINSKVNQMTNAVTILQEAAAKDNPGSISAVSCCSVKNAKYSPNYKAKVDFGMVCSLLKKTSIAIGSSFKDKAFNNDIDFPFLRWQHTCTLRAGGVIFPSSRKLCSSKELYFQSMCHKRISQIPKKIVLAIDLSSSMKLLEGKISRLQIAIDFAKNVINSLTSFDKFTIITFSDYVHVKPILSNFACSSTSFVVASQRNKALTFSFLDSLKTEGGTSFSVAIFKAFSYYKNEVIANYVNAIFLFTDHGSSGSTDQPLSQTILQKVTNEINSYNDSISIFIYVVAKGDHKDLQQLSQLTKKKQSRCAVIDGVYLVEELAKIFTILSPVNSAKMDPTWTLADELFLGTGTQVAASLPYYSNNVVQGAVTVQAELEDLFLEAVHYQPRADSYAFVIDTSGLVFYYPSDTSKYNTFITNLEQHDDFLSIYDSMMNGQNGAKTIHRRKLIVVDASFNTVPTVRLVQSLYTWKKIPKTKFIVCSVVDTGQLAEITNQLSLPIEDFLYHRLDIAPPAQPCQHIHRYCSSKLTSIFIELSGIEDARTYRDKNLEKSDVEGIGRWLSGSQENKFKIKDVVKRDVVISNKLNELWSVGNAYSYTLGHVLWRYLITKHGVIRTFPGTNLPTALLKATTSLYRKTIDAAADKYIVLPPFTAKNIDAPLITLSKVIRRGKQENFGVLGVTMFFEFFHGAIAALYRNITLNSTSTKVYIVDSGGYSLLSDEYLKEHNEVKLRVHHLAFLERTVFSSMFHTGVFRAVNCSNLKFQQLKRQYRITSQNLSSGSVMDVDRKCVKFKIQPIPQTNLYLLETNKLTVACTPPTVDYSACVCNFERCQTFWTGYTCECPCFTDNTYSIPCNNSWSKTFNYFPPLCLIQLANDIPKDRVKIKYGSLPACYKLVIPIRNKEEEEQAGEFQVPLIILLISIWSVLFGFIYDLRKKQVFVKKKEEFKSKVVTQVLAEMLRGTQESRGFSTPRLEKHGSKTDSPTGSFLVSIKEDDKDGNIFNTGGEHMFEVDALNRKLLPPVKHKRKKRKRKKTNLDSQYSYYSEAGTTSDENVTLKPEENVTPKPEENVAPPPEENVAANEESLSQTEYDYESESTEAPLEKK